MEQVNKLCMQNAETCLMLKEGDSYVYLSVLEC